MPMLRSRIHSRLSRKRDEVPNRIALNVNGEKSDNAPFTAVKFSPQMKLMATSIKSIVENLRFPFAVNVRSPAVDFHLGHCVSLSEGRILKALTRSASKTHEKSIFVCEKMF